MRLEAIWIDGCVNRGFGLGRRSRMKSSSCLLGDLRGAMEIFESLKGASGAEEDLRTVSEESSNSGGVLQVLMGILQKFFDYRLGGRAWSATEWSGNGGWPVEAGRVVAYGWDTARPGCCAIGRWQCGCAVGRAVAVAARPGWQGEGGCRRSCLHLVGLLSWAEEEEAADHDSSRGAFSFSLLLPRGPLEELKKK
ncbi:hypothetical protein KSP40_PGU022770 [Platanthera guangdongensis]|uniref:Uncharacterized protein n=1 Tax=Platanthera guangdongensis TaxID=2320717 RepID=A0ABR2LKX7_9ASPA